MENEKKCNDCQGCTDECNNEDIVAGLEETIEELNSRYIDILTKFKALQDEYNKVCAHRDTLFELINKLL